MERLELRKYTVIWRGKSLINVTGLSPERVAQDIVSEMGLEKLPAKTVIFESHFQ